MIAKSVASGTIIGGAIGIYEGAKHDRAAIAARLTGGLPGAGFGIAAATSLTGADAHPITTTTSQVLSFETSFYVPDDHHPIAPGDVFAGEDGAPIYMHTERLPDATVTTHGIGSLPAAAIAAGVHADASERRSHVPRQPVRIAH